MTNEETTVETSVETSVVSGVVPWGQKKLPQRNSRKFQKDDLPKLPYFKPKKTGECLSDVRIVTGLAEYSAAKWKSPLKNYPMWIKSASPNYDDCPLVNDLGLKLKTRSVVIAIDRADNQLKIFDMSPMIEEQILTTLEVKNRKRPEGAKVTPLDFDISIKVTPDNAQAYYSVVFDDVAPLSEGDINLINDIGGEDVLNKILAKQKICPKRETVIKRLMDLGWDGKPVSATEDAQSEEQVTLSEPEEEDYSFAQPDSETADVSAAE